MRIINYLLTLLAFSFFCSATALAEEKEEAYVVEDKGRTTLRLLFDKKEETSASQWEYALATKNKGWLKKADRRMLYLVRRWPNSKEAPLAARARADMFYSRNKLDAAFTEYQYLIDNYASRMEDYSSVLESQFLIAVEVMNKKRMRWLFGGYRAPEKAVDYFEDVIRNGPQWEKAPEVQFLIGQAYQEDKDYEMAISAYSVLGYRYPDSEFAEEAAWQQIDCLKKLRIEYPNNMDLPRRQLVATTVFITTYPKSARRNDVILLRNELYEVQARKLFTDAEFYVKVSHHPKAAIIYYEQMIKEFPQSKLVPVAKERIAELNALMATPLIGINSAEKKKERAGAEKDVEDVER